MEVHFRGKAAERGAIGLRLLDGDIERVAKASRPRVKPYLVWALADVEADGNGFLPDGRVKCLFEAHQFSRLTGGAFDGTHPTLSCRRWNRSLYWGGAAEYVRLERAMELDRNAALEATSWGLGQIMGFNARDIGYGSAGEMISAFADDAAEHVAAMLRYLHSARALNHLRGLRFERVARAYNGPRYAENRYHLRLGLAAAARADLPWAVLGAVGDRVGELQAALAAQGHDIGRIDRALGPRTAAALLAYQAATRKPHPFWS